MKNTFYSKITLLSIVDQILLSICVVKESRVEDSLLLIQEIQWSILYIAVVQIDSVRIVFKWYNQRRSELIVLDL